MAHKRFIPFIGRIKPLRLPNAFKYRESFVTGCSCNGKDATGLASVSIDDDKTIRKGDIVAGKDGIVIATQQPDRRARSAAAVQIKDGRFRNAELNLTAPEECLAP